MAEKSFGLKQINMIGVGTPAIESSDDLIINTNGSERIRILSGGNLGIGVTNPESKLVIAAPSATAQIEIKRTNSNSGGTVGALNFTALDGHSVASISAVGDGDNEGAYLAFRNTSDAGENSPFGNSTTERMRLASNGEQMVFGQATVSALRTAAASSGSSEILYCSRNSTSVTVGTGVYAIYSNGSAGALSDQTQKKNIETTRDGYLEDLNRLRVVKYNWNDQEDGTPKELGLIAQEVEEVFPGLISDMRSDVGIGSTVSYKGIKTSVLPYMLLKALQEANAEIAALSARITALENP